MDKMTMAVGAAGGVLGAALWKQRRVLGAVLGTAVAYGVHRVFTSTKAAVEAAAGKTTQATEGLDE